MYKYIGKISAFKLTVKEIPQDKSIEGYFKAKYCSFRMSALILTTSKLLDLIPKRKDFAGKCFPNPLKT